MLKSHHLFSCLGSVALSALIGLSGIAQAQVQISPLVIETEAQRGQARGTINVTNVSQETFRARIYAAPFTYGRSGMEILESSPTDLSPYLIFSPRELVVEPGQTRRIRISARMLPSLPNGEYRAILFTENLTATEVERDGVTVGIVPRIGVTVYVRHGEVNSNLAVESATVDAAQSRINLLVSNSGDASERPKTEWTLRRNGTTIQTGQTSHTTVTAGGDRYIAIQGLNTNELLTPGTYQLTGRLIWGDSRSPQILPFEVPLPMSAEAASLP